MDYRREIDGLRALAVLPVILFHAGFEAFSGGFVGVDVFFVISGYLITTIILGELAQGEFSIAKFYERRARRILPALFFVILACLPVAWVMLDPFEMKEFSQSIFATSLFSSNVYFFLKTGYFDISAELKPLLHTWSLAVEEHYYILFPLALMPLWRHGRKLILPVFAAIFVASLLFAQWSVHRHPSMAFYLLPARAWEILLGTLCAILLSRKEQPMLMAPQWLNQLGSLIGLALIVVAIFAFDGKTLSPGPAMLVPTVGAALIILFARPGTIANSVLGLPGVVLIGIVSYSAYLWHQPALAFFRLYFVEDPSHGVALALIALVFALAWLTYRYVETPFRARGALNLTRRQVFAFALLGLLAMGVIGFAGHHWRGFPSRNEQTLRLGQNGGLSFACSGAELDDKRCQSKPDPKIILWGDSYAMHLAQALADVYPDQGLWQMTLSSCPPVPGYMDAPIKAAITCDAYNERVIQRLRTLPHPEQYTVVMSSTSNLSGKVFREGTSRTFKELGALGYKLVLVSATPRYGGTLKCLKMHARQDGDFSSCTFDFKDTMNYTFFPAQRKFSEEHNVRFVDLSKLFCDGQSCGIQKDGVLLLRDEGHMSTESTGKLAAFLRGELRPAAAQVAGTAAGQAR